MGPPAMAAEVSNVHSLFTGWPSSQWLNSNLFGGGGQMMPPARRVGAKLQGQESWDGAPSLVWKSGAMSPEVFEILHANVYILLFLHRWLIFWRGKSYSRPNIFIWGQSSPRTPPGSTCLLSPRVSDTVQTHGGHSLKHCFHEVLFEFSTSPGGLIPPTFVHHPQLTGTLLIPLTADRVLNVIFTVITWKLEAYPGQTPALSSTSPSYQIVHRFYPSPSTPIAANPCRPLLHRLLGFTALASIVKQWSPEWVEFYVYVPLDTY